MPDATLNRDSLYTTSEKAGEQPSNKRHSSFSYWITTPAFALVTGIGLLLIIGCSESSKPEVEMNTSKVDQISNQPEEENHSLASKMAIEAKPKAQPVSKPVTSEEPVSKPVPDLKKKDSLPAEKEKIQLLTFKIIRFKEGIKQTILGSKDFAVTFALLIHQAVENNLIAKVDGYETLSLKVDLLNEKITLKLNQSPPENLTEIINDIPDKLITVSNKYTSITTKASTPTEPIVPTNDENSQILTFKILKLPKGANLSIGFSKDGKKLETSMIASGIEDILEDNVHSFKPGSVHVDLDKKEIRLQADQNDAELLVRYMNNLPVNPITVADLPNDTETQMRAKLEAARGTAPLNYSAAFEIKKIEAGLEKQIAIDPIAGAQTLADLLNHQLQQSIPEYLPNTVKLDLEYREMIIHLNQYPENALYTKINKIPSIPVNVIPVANTLGNPIKELRTPEQLKPTQVTYRILSYADQLTTGLENSNFYHSSRGRVFHGLLLALKRKVTGYIPETLDVNFAERTVTFQLDHVPATDLGMRISKEFFNETTLSALPISIGPPQPPFQTPGRPLRLVVLKIDEFKIANETFKNGQIPVVAQRRLKGEEFKLNSAFQSNLSNYILNSTEIDPRQMLLAIQLDRIPPSDLVKQINYITNSSFYSNIKIADEIVAVHEVEYDPEASEKTLFFQFTNNNVKSPQHDEDYIWSQTNNIWLRVNRYIPNSLKMDFDQGILSVRQRIGGIEREEIAEAVKNMNGFKLNVTHIKTTLPQTNKKVHPMGIGIVTGAGSASATNSRSTTNSPTGMMNVPVGQNVVVTVQYGLYGGRKKPKTSAFDVIKGFSWIDRKSLKVDTAKKEFTFKTKGPYNGGAIDRALKRNKFYKCNVTHEAVTDETEAQK